MAGTSGAPVVVVGAGVAGLSCARALADGGRRVLVIERARAVGGRCATRTVEGQEVDVGVAFLHGRDARFLAALGEVEATPLRGWPRQVHGSGRPCQPEAFAPGEVRLAFAEGVGAFTRHLARGLEVRLQRRVVALGAADGTVGLRFEDGAVMEAEDAVLALAAEQVDELLGTLAPAPPAVHAARAVLGMARSDACLSLAATYPPGTPAPGWHVSYPEGSRMIQLVSHDSAKRPRPPFLTLVFQAHPAWSHHHLEDPEWPRAILDEAARLLGPWAAAPRSLDAHRWRHARTDLAAELAGPLLLELPSGGRLGIAGDRFAPGGGVEAAWVSGRRLAGRILGEAR